jgi:hypothetical protein
MKEIDWTSPHIERNHFGLEVASGVVILKYRGEGDEDDVVGLELSPDDARALAHAITTLAGRAEKMEAAEQN